MAGRGGSCCWGGNVLLLFLDFFGGSWGHSKVLVSGPAADHMFSPASCNVNPKRDFPHLPLARDLQVCSPVLLFSSHPKRKLMKKRQKII